MANRTVFAFDFGTKSIGLAIGQEVTLTARARKFANRLHGRFGVQVELHDERLSTVEARAELFDRGGFRALDKGSVDAASAVIILESWFEKQWSQPAAESPQK